jgi:hypothetical protein
MPDGPWLTKTLQVKRRCGKSESECSEEIGWVDENEQDKPLLSWVKASAVESKHAIPSDNQGFTLSPGVWDAPMC